MKKLFVTFLLFALFAAISVLAITQAAAQKESHGDYKEMKTAECNDCHKGQGVAPNHDSNWLQQHRLPAMRGASNCSECHDQAWCLDCHQGGGIDVDLSTRNYRRDYVPKSHRNDFLELHPLKAKMSPQTCNRCHDQKYCVVCHSRFQGPDLQFQSHRRQFTDAVSAVGPNHALFTAADCQNCHPNGLLPSHNVWSANHATEARRNLRACQTCHSEGDVCMKCHSTRTGLKVNPHPRNWNAIKDNFKGRSGGRTCRQCHDTF